ncbi:SDR family NAD(P)-dependent oxidoreductase [Nocardia brasiliensis]|uniref:SDR family NAD(P)-dependent oxidoreductase n=1 Tax=Nocardia brasiliensis TaxID=37326 RepID=UPI00366AA2A2
MDRLRGKVAIVTGAASGMGRASVVAMLGHGAAVVAVDIDADGLARLAADQPSERLSTAHADVTDQQAIRHIVEAAERRFGAINVLSTSAAVARSSPFLAMTPQDWELTMRVNVTSVALTCQAVIPSMRRAGGGSIITWGSVASVVAEEGFAAYSASKGAVLMLTKTIAIEHARDRIRANCLCPGMVDTPMAAPYLPRNQPDRNQYLDEMTSWQPLGLGTPQQLADVAVFLAADESSFITGSAIMADGGFTAM